MEYLTICLVFPGLDSILESVTERGAGKHKDKQDKKRTRKEKLKESKEKQEAQEQVTKNGSHLAKTSLIRYHTKR